ncbi:MAG TPA: GNAT family N-acetyltransferase [Burkholderiales bacterium]|nr:GNAT family N-acetyltransferase [Burkholderiales bacterium]
MSATEQYDVFLAGELVDLVVPNERAIQVDGWHNWFNDQALTRNMEQGMYPKSPESQMRYLAELRENPARLALMIKPKDADGVVGICSLAKISHVTRQADFAMVIAKRSDSFKSVFYGMEAKCLMTEHAFETLALERINSYQSTALKDWQRWQILFGYKMEGIMRKAFRKGYKTYDLMVSGCLLEDYVALKELRGGRLWPGQERIMALIRELPEESLEQKLTRAYSEIVQEHYARIRMA